MSFFLRCDSVQFCFTFVLELSLNVLVEILGKKLTKRLPLTTMPFVGVITINGFANCSCNNFKVEEILVNTTKYRFICVAFNLETQNRCLFYISLDFQHVFICDVDGYTLTTNNNGNVGRLNISFFCEIITYSGTQ